MRRKASREARSQHYHDPCLFSRDILGLEPWPRQAEIFEAVARHARVAVRSGHKIGKSTAGAALALWWFTTRKRARVILTSASSRQVRAILWSEVRRLYSGARFPFGCEMHELPDRGLRIESLDREIVGFSTDDPERMAGYSGPNMLIIADEAAGISQQIFEAIEGNRAGGARLVMFSNPTRTSGTFYDAFNTKREWWHTIHISSEEASHYEIPGLARKEWIEEKKREWGPESPLYQVRVLGNFPSQAESSVVPLYLVEEARRRWDDGDNSAGRLELGVDVARFGDDETVIQPKRGNRAFAPIVLRSLDVVQVAGAVLDCAKQLRHVGELPVCKVDSIGIGAGVCDVLRRSEQVQVWDVNVAERATTEGYSRLRDQLWGSIKDWLKEGGALPPDAKLEAELVSPTYSFDAQGRVKVEAKDEIKRRLGRSPDRADALALALYQPKHSNVSSVIDTDIRFEPRRMSGGTDTDRFWESDDD